MKKLLFFAGLVISCTVFSQPHKGNFLVTGNLSFENSKLKRLNDDDVTLNHNSTGHLYVIAEAEYFLTDRISAGLFDRPLFNRIVDDNDDVYKEKINYIGLASRYFFPVGKGGVYFELLTGPQFGKGENEDGAYTISGYFAGIYPGLYYYFTERIAAEAEFGTMSYEFRKIKPADTYYYISQSDLGLEFSPWSLSLGLSFKF
jgi:hypothetical protein